jgi:hypothetical protein
MTREEHIAFCERRALEYLDAGDLANAVASFGMDFPRHSETSRGVNPSLMGVALRAVMANDAVAVRRFINGFK